jgi:peptidoglycan/xylan/chitin deacetylase (PgdA/CDA1 family)
MMSAWITTSWDDGHPLDFRVAELLTKYGLTGTFYVPRTAETGVMNEAQIRELAKHFEIGAHTLDHVYLDRVSELEAKHQIIGSKQWIEDTIGSSCEMFCFPGGKFRGEHLEMLRKAGFLAVRTVECFSFDLPRVNGTCAVMPTTLQAYPHGWISYARNALRRGELLALLRYSLAPDARNWVSFAEKLARHAVDRGGVFHLWGHSWEIEKHGRWRELETVFAFLSRCRGGAKVQTNSELLNHGR